MKKIITIMTLVICLYLGSGTSLQAAETFWDMYSNLFDLLFLFFSAAVILFMIKVVKTIVIRTPRRHRKDRLQNYFNNWLEN